MRRLRHYRNGTGAPLQFDDNLKWRLYRRLKRLDYVKYLRWYKDMSYLRFKIFDNCYKIIVSPSYRPYEKIRYYNSEEWIYYKPVPVFDDGIFVINATQFYDTIDEIIATCIDLHNWTVDYLNNEEMTKMEEYAASLNMDPTIFDYDCIIKDGRWKYSICHSKEIEELITELAKKYIAYLNLKDNRFGALLEIMKGMACIIFDDKIIGKELQKQKISQ